MELLQKKMKPLPSKTTFIVCNGFNEFMEIAERYTHDRIQLPKGCHGYFATKNMVYQYAHDYRTLLGRAQIIVEFYKSARNRPDFSDLEKLARNYEAEKRWTVKWHDETYTHSMIKERIEKQERELGK